VTNAERWIEAYSWPRLSCCGGREVCSKLPQYGFCDTETWGSLRPWSKVGRQKGDAHISVDIADIAIAILFGIPNGPRGPEFFAMACAIKTWDGHPMARWQS